MRRWICEDFACIGHAPHCEAAGQPLTALGTLRHDGADGSRDRSLDMVTLEQFRYLPTHAARPPACFDFHYAEPGMVAIFGDNGSGKVRLRS